MIDAAAAPESVDMANYDQSNLAIWENYVNTDLTMSSYTFSLDDSPNVDESYLKTFMALSVILPWTTNYLSLSSIHTFSI